MGLSGSKVTMFEAILLRQTSRMHCCPAQHEGLTALPTWCTRRQACVREPAANLMDQLLMAALQHGCANVAQMVREGVCRYARVSTHIDIGLKNNQAAANLTADE